MKTVYNRLTGPALSVASVRDPGRVIAEFGGKGTQSVPRVLREEEIKRLPPYLWASIKHLHATDGTCWKTVFASCPAPTHK